MVIAQALGEYGALASGGASGFTAAFGDTVITLGDQVRHMEPSTWAFVALVVVGVWFLMRK